MAMLSPAFRSDLAQPPLIVDKYRDLSRHATAFVGLELGSRSHSFWQRAAKIEHSALIGRSVRVGPNVVRQSTPGP